MNIGFFAIGLAELARPEILAAAATTAERVGFSTLWAAEHIVFVEKIDSPYPYARDTTAPPVPTDLPILNPFVALGYAAAVTKRIRLATGVCLVPEYNPLLLAKLAASLDFVSGGRFVFGMGIGWMKEEFQALGVPWERRAARSREAVEAMRRLWEDSTSSYSGEFFSFAGAGVSKAGPQDPDHHGGTDGSGAEACGELCGRLVRIQSHARRDCREGEAPRAAARR